MGVEEKGVIGSQLRKFIFSNKMFILTLNRDWKEPSLPSPSSLSRIGGRGKKSPSSGLPTPRWMCATLSH